MAQANEPLPSEVCWQTGNYTDDCCCELCEHYLDCSASGYDEDEE